MNDSTPDPESTNLDISVVWAAFEAAWYEEPPRRLTAAELCAMFPKHPCEQIHAKYREHWLELYWSDLRIELEELAREKRPPSWANLVDHAPELVEKAKAHFAKCGGREPSTFFAEVAASLNLRDYPGTRASYEKERLQRQQQQVQPEDQLKPIERDFELTGVTGNGGFGIVFEAYDAVLDRRVAIKKVLPGLSDCPEAKERLEREAMILAKLEHPNILPMYNILKPHPQAGKVAEPAFVMRLLPKTLLQSNSSSSGNGEPPKVIVRRLKDAIQEFYGEKVPGDPSKPLPWDATVRRRNKFRELLQQFVDVCHGIAFAHQRKVIHRDIKPGNVVIGPHGETVIIDWGIARVLVEDDRRADDLSGPATLVEDMGFQFTLEGSGTGPYASPEQWPRQPDDLRPVHPVHPKLTFDAARQPTDVYALGATLWEILNGRTPPEGVSHEHRFADFLEGTPYELQQIVRKATAFDPWERYISRRELEWFRSQLPGLKARTATGADSQEYGEDATLSGVEQLRQAVQSWLDEEAANQIAGPFKRAILSLEGHASRLKWRVITLTAAAVVIGVVAGVMFIQSTRTIRSLSKNVESLSQEKLRVGQAVGQLRDQNQQLERNAKESKRRAQESELRAEAAVQRRDLLTILDNLDSRSIAGAKERLNAVSDPPDTFAWNYVRQAASVEGPRTLVGNPNGIAAHRGQVLAVSFDQDGNYLSFGADGRLLTWDSVSEHPVRESLVGPTAGRLGLGFDNRNGKLLVTELAPSFPAAESGQIRLNDQILAVGTSINGLLPVDGKEHEEIRKMLSGDVGSKVQIKLIRPGSDEPIVVELPRKTASAVPADGWENAQVHRFSPNGRWLAASAALDAKYAEIYLIETATGELRRTWKMKEVPDYGLTFSLNFSGNNERLVLAGRLPKSADKPEEFELKGIVVDLTRPDVPMIDQELVNSGYPPMGWVISRDGRTVMGVGLGLEIFPYGLWRVGTKEPAQRIEALPKFSLTSSVGYLNTVSPDGRYLAMSRVGWKVDILLGDGSEHIVTIGHGAPRRGIAFNQDATLFAVADGSWIEIYANGWQSLTRLPFDMTFQSANVNPVMAFSPDGQSLLVGSEAGAQVIPLGNAIEPPAQTDFGPHVEFTASRWSGNGDKSTLWIAESGRSSPGISLQQLDSGGNVKQTLVSSLVGRIQTIPVMSQDGKRVFVSRTPASWAKTSLLQTWELDGQPHVAWSRTFDSGAARVIRDFPDGGVLVETYTHREHFSGDSLLPSSYNYLDSKGNPLHSVPHGPDAPWRITPRGELLSIYPFPLATLIKYGRAQDAAIYLTSQDRKRRRTLKVQALNAVVSDDDQYLAAVVVDDEQNSWDYGTLKIFSMSDFREVASLKDRKIHLPFDFGLNFSPDGNRVAVACIGGQVIVWDHVKDDVLFDTVWKPEGWQQAWLSGAMFTPDGKSLIVAGYDRQALTDMSRWGADPRQIGGLLAMIDLTKSDPEIRVVRNDVGLVALGEASRDRSRFCSVDLISGEARVWEVGGGEPQLAATLKSNSGAYDPRWAQFVSIDAISLTADEKRLAAAGSARIGDNLVTRIVVFDLETKTVISSADSLQAHVDDVTWMGDDLRLLTHDDNGQAQLWAWKPGPDAMSKIASHKASGAIVLRRLGSMTHPQFDLSGTSYAVPMLLTHPTNTTQSTQTVCVFRSGTGAELAKPAEFPMGHTLQGFQWGYDGRLAITTIAADNKELTRHLSLWNPQSGEFKPFITDRPPRTVGGFASARQAHVMISPDGDSVIVGEFNQPFIEVWSESEKQRTCRIALKSAQTLRTLQISPNGDALFLAQVVAGATLLRAPRQAKRIQPVDPE